MKYWITGLWLELRQLLALLMMKAASRQHRKHDRHEAMILHAGRLSAAILLVAGIVSASLYRPDLSVRLEALPSAKPTKDAHIDLTRPVREEPERFRARTHRPNVRESRASGPVDLHTFFPVYDLVRVDDPRVWWESDHDTNDTEDDHMVHRAMEEPLRRLIELVVREGGTLKVQDTYRPEGIHAPRSLHKEGRAIDITCDELGLEKLARLAWAAGFDWVYNEAPKRGGAHVHASVHRDRTAMTASQN